MSKLDIICCPFSFEPNAKSGGGGVKFLTFGPQSPYDKLRRRNKILFILSM